jgi:[pyruvate, water dikinase]-phosphate phosphotransferase / [pyruvate, water dikinase] kinase
MDGQNTDSRPPPIFIVSGGTGASGEQLVRTVLAQFRRPVPIVLVPNVHSEAELAELVEKAAAVGGTIVHTLVNSSLRKALGQMAQPRAVLTIDLMGPLLDWLALALGEQPAEKPGLYHHQREAYFERVAAIEYSVEHDDGQRVSELPEAQIVLVGVSRSGKTPLSMYLAINGWKVANVPLIRDIPPPPVLLEIDPRRVVGLTVEPGQLIAHRKWRQAELGVGGGSPYVDGEAIYEEVQEVRRFCRRSGFAILDVTDKPIESSAAEVIELVTSRLKTPRPA